MASQRSRAHNTRTQVRAHQRARYPTGITQGATSTAHPTRNAGYTNANFRDAKRFIPRVRILRLTRGHIRVSDVTRLIMFNFICLFFFNFIIVSILENKLSLRP